MRHKLKTDPCCLEPHAAHGRAGKDKERDLLANEDRKVGRQVPEVTKLSQG